MSAAVVAELQSVPIAGPCRIAEIVEAVLERPTVDLRYAATRFPEIKAVVRIPP